MPEPLPRVLLVDDEPHVLAALTRHLKGRFDVATAHSGAEALKVLETKGPVAVVMPDMKMPSMSGATLQGRVRERYPSTTRVILSGTTSASSTTRSRPSAASCRLMVMPRSS